MNADISYPNLISALYGFQLSVKANHFNAKDWQLHLVYDKIYDSLAPLIDEAGEILISSTGLQIESILNISYDFTKDLKLGIDTLLQLINDIRSNTENLNIGEDSLLSDMYKEFLLYKGWLVTAGVYKIDDAELDNQISTNKKSDNESKWDLLSNLNLVDKFIETNNSIKVSKKLDDTDLNKLKSKGLEIQNNTLVFTE